MGNGPERRLRRVGVGTLALANLAACLGPTAQVALEPQAETRVGGIAAVAPTSDPTLLLPDLVPHAPRELYVRLSAQTGGRELRFSTTIANMGDGPLVLDGRFDPQSGRTVATQRIATVKDTLEQVVGSFVFHPTHDHWHFESFTMFELWSLRSDGAPGSIVATTGKMTFCIRDAERVNRNLPNASPGRTFDNCERNRQGISVGWGDTYRAKTTGQHLDLRNVPDGWYAIKTISDPENRLLEKDETNNVTTGYVQIAGMVVRAADRE